MTRLFSNIDLFFALMAQVGRRTFGRFGSVPARQCRSVEEVAWLRQRAAAKRARRMDRNRWNREMELCGGRTGRHYLCWYGGIRWAIAHGYLKPKHRRGHAAH